MQTTATKKPLPKIPAPPGYKVRIAKQYNRLYCYLDHKFPNGKYYQIGYVQLEETPLTTTEKKKKMARRFRTHSHLDEKFQGIGLGTLIYSRAILFCLQHGYKVSSSGSSSPAAQKVWKGKGIRQYFRIKEVKAKTRSRYGYNSGPTWYAYQK